MTGDDGREMSGAQPGSSSTNGERNGAVAAEWVGRSLLAEGAVAPPAQFRMVLVSCLAAGIGLVAGFIAYLLYRLIGFLTNVFFFHRLSADFASARLNHLGPWVIAIPVIGGLIVGVMAKYGTPKIRGHGIPEAMEAVLVNRSRTEPRFGVILAIELLLFEFKSRSFIPLVVASTLATAVHLQLLGGGPMFQVAAMDFGIPRALPFYLLLGGICGLAAVGFSKALYWMEDKFEKLPVDQLWWPAIGGLGLGIIGYFVPRVLGVGYDTIGDILNARLGLEVLLIVMVAKAVALTVSLGSGTSGGL